MTGRYLIYTPLESVPNERRFDSSWSRFVQVCRSLSRDGLAYVVRFNLAGFNPHILVTANGTGHLQKQPSKARHSTLPPPIPKQRCRERALEVEWFLPENLGRRNAATTYWRTRQSRYLELSRLAEEHLRAELEYWRELELL